MVDKKKVYYLLVVIISFSIALTVIFAFPVVNEARATLQGNSIIVVGNIGNVDSVSVYFDDGVTWSQMDLSGKNLTQTGDLVRSYQVLELNNSQGSVNFIVVVVLNNGVADNLEQVKFEVKTLLGIVWIDVDYAGIE